MEHNFEANFFTLLELLDPASRLEVEGACTKLSLPAHQVVYEQDYPSNAVYIISSGLVEAVTTSPDGKQTRSVGHMGKGDFFGDLGVLTGQNRLARVHTCEPTKLLQIEKLAFQRLLEKVPKMGAYFSRNLARRLHQTSTQAHLDIYSVDLAGNLKHFDLLTIFQAITSMGRTGELRLNNSSNELIGSFFFRQGKTEHARFSHLEGTEAIWQGFVELATDGTFVFHVMGQPTAQFTAETKIEMESIDLLMQGASRRDAYQSLPEPLRKMEGRLSRLTETLSWTDPDTQALAERIWELISKRPQPLGSLWRRLHHSSVTFLETIDLLMKSGQVDILKDEPAGEKPA